PHRAFPLRAPNLPVEILADHDVRRRLRPARRHLDVFLLEDRHALLVADQCRALLPFHVVKWGSSSVGEVPLKPQAALRARALRRARRFHRFAIQCWLHRCHPSSSPLQVPVSQRGTLLFYYPVRQGVARHSRGRATPFQVSWKTDVWENRKKANALPGAGDFHTAEQLTPRLTALRGAFSSRSLFYGDPGLVSWVKCRTKANPRLWSVWRFHVPRIWNWSIVPRGVGVKRKSQNLDNFFFTCLYLVVRFPARCTDFLRLQPLSFS